MLRHRRPAVLLVLALALFSLAPPAFAKGLERTERWYDFRFHGKKVGFLTAIDEPTEIEGKPAIHSLRRSLITVRRMENVIRMESTSDAWAEPSGKPIRFKHTRDEGGAARSVEGNRNGDTMLVRIDVGGTLSEKKYPITPDLILSTSLDALFKSELRDKKSQKGQAVIEEDGTLSPYTIAVTGTDKIAQGSAFVVESEIAGVSSKEWVLPGGDTVKAEVARLGAEFVETSREEALKLPETEDIFTKARLLTHAALPSGDELETVQLKLSGAPARCRSP
jgi:hypothetical protein